MKPAPAVSIVATWLATSALLGVAAPQNPARVTVTGETKSAVRRKAPSPRIALRAIAVANAGRWVATASEETHRPIALFKGPAGSTRVNLKGTEGEVPHLFTPDGTRLITTNAPDDPEYEEEFEEEDAPSLILRAVPSGTLIRSFALDRGPLWCDSARLRGLNKNSILDFDLKTGRRLSVHRITNAPPRGEFKRSYAFSRNGDLLVEGSGGVIRWWNARTGQMLGSIKAGRMSIGRTAISDDGQWLASSGISPKKGMDPQNMSEADADEWIAGDLHIWNTRSRKLSRTMPGFYVQNDSAALLTFSPDTRTLVAAAAEGMLRYDLRSGRKLTLRSAAKINFNWALPVALSNDGKWMAGEGAYINPPHALPPDNRTLHLWSPESLPRRIGATASPPSLTD